MQKLCGFFSGNLQTSSKFSLWEESLNLSERQIQMYLFPFFVHKSFPIASLPFPNVVRCPVTSPVWPGIAWTKSNQEQLVRTDWTDQHPKEENEWLVIMVSPLSLLACRKKRTSASLVPWSLWWWWFRWKSTWSQPVKNATTTLVLVGVCRTLSLFGHQRQLRRENDRIKWPLSGASNPPEPGHGQGPSRAGAWWWWLLFCRLAAHTILASNDDDDGMVSNKSLSMGEWSSS